MALEQTTIKKQLDWLQLVVNALQSDYTDRRSGACRHSIASIEATLNDAVVIVERLKREYASIPISSAPLVPLPADLKATPLRAQSPALAIERVRSAARSPARLALSAAEAVDRVRLQDNLAAARALSAEVTSSERAPVVALPVPATGIVPLPAVNPIGAALPVGNGIPLPVVGAAPTTMSPARIAELQAYSPPRSELDAALAIDRAVELQVIADAAAARAVGGAPALLQAMLPGVQNITSLSPRTPSFVTPINPRVTPSSTITASGPLQPLPGLNFAQGTGL